MTDLSNNHQRKVHLKNKVIQTNDVFQGGHPRAGVKIHQRELLSIRTKIRLWLIITFPWYFLIIL